MGNETPSNYPGRAGVLLQHRNYGRQTVGCYVPWLSSHRVDTYPVVGFKVYVIGWIVGSGLDVCDEGKMKLLRVVRVSEMVLLVRIQHILWYKELVMQMQMQQAKREPRGAVSSRCMLKYVTEDGKTNYQNVFELAQTN